MPSKDRAAVLRAIAFGDDPRVSPSDRLKALDQLQALEGGDADAATLRIAIEVAAMSDDELDRELSGLMVNLERPSLTYAEVDESVRLRIEHMIEIGELIRPERQEARSQDAHGDEQDEQRAPQSEPVEEDAELRTAVPPGLDDEAMRATWESDKVLGRRR